MVVSIGGGVDGVFVTAVACVVVDRVVAFVVVVVIGAAVVVAVGVIVMGGVVVVAELSWLSLLLLASLSS